MVSKKPLIKSLVPIIPTWKQSFVFVNHPSPSKYPRIKCLIKSLGTFSSVGNVKTKDFLGTHPLSIKSCLHFELLKEYL